MDAADRTLARERERFLSGGGARPRVREEIRSSWRRCSSWSVPAERFAPPYRPDVNPESRLLRAARPVLDALGERLGELGVGFVVTDAGARILDRRAREPRLLRTLDALHVVPGFVFSEDAVGTNGLGTAVELGRTTRVDGHEHYADQLVRFTCVGVPILDPIARYPLGVLDLTCAADPDNPLITLLAEQAARAVEARLFEQHSMAERALLARFMSVSRRSRSGVVVLNDRMLLSNPMAARLLDGVEQALLHDHAALVADLGAAAAPPEGELTAADGRVVRTRTTPVYDGDRVIGAMVELRPLDVPAPRPPTSRPVPAAAPDGLAGTDRAFLGACRAARVALAARPLLLCGEPGTGKFAVGLALCREHDDEPVVRDAAQPGADPDLWPAELRAVLSGPPGALVLRHADLLAPDVLRRTGAVLACAVRSGWRCAVTSGEGPSGSAGDTAELLLGDLGAEQVTLPPLRNRLRDVPALVAAFAAPRRMAPEAVQLLLRLSWPGNVRELRTVVRRTLDAAAPGVTPGPDDLPPQVRRAAPRRSLTRFERAEVHAILEALAETGGNRRDAAALLGISRSTLYRKLQSAGVDLTNTVF